MSAPLAHGHALSTMNDVKAGVEESAPVFR